MTALTDPSVVKERAIKAWYYATRDRYPHVTIPDWRTSTTPDGTPHLSAEAVGPGFAGALHHFAANAALVLGDPGDQRPVVDYRDGRVVCSWRSAGVWVELWHPEAPFLTDETKIRFASPSGRLPFARRNIRTVMERL